ncbi:hypothetical protein BE221DRAFT_148087 [Ostreococcus tauri]|uniref:SMP-LTD domain-containing protein n=1 Tax=Ostreococcus tauri TaxID=70448 RepID=A0A1Y5I9R6_OSTTA|nr:hypothetical protein BE221DRAFT_148087 [Ostreococcus tauri]
MTSATTDDVIRGSTVVGRLTDALRASTSQAAKTQTTDAATSRAATPRVVVDFASQMLAFFAFSWESACWSLLAALFVGTWLRRTWRRRMRKALASAEMQHSLDSQFTTVEHGAMEWINHLLRHLWMCTAGTFADQQVNDIAKGIIEGLAETKPSFVKDVQLADFTLGSMPPKIKLYTTRYNPTLDYLQFEFDIDWYGDSAHARLVTKIKLAAAIPSLTVPIHLTDFGLRGRLLVGMRLTKRMPGVSGMDVSFRGAPKVDVSVRPVGLPISDIPGLYDWIMGKIEDVLCKKFLEPRRMYVDVEGKFLEKMASADFLGKGGTLVCRVMTLKGVPTSKASGYPWVEVTYNGSRKITATRPLNKVMHFGGALAFPLPDDTNWKSTDADDNERMELGTVRVRVMDRAPVGKDIFIMGEAVFGAHRRTESETHYMSLSLGSHAETSKYGVSTKVPIIARIEWEVLPPISRWDPLKPAVSKARSAIPMRHTADSGADNTDDDGGGDDVDIDVVDDDDDDDDDYLEGHETSGVLSEPNVASDGEPHSPLARRRSDVSTRIDSNEADAKWQTLDVAAEYVLQLAKLRVMLQRERDASTETIAGLKSDLSLARETLLLERERRAQELKRALLEGVRIFVHTKNSKAGLTGKDEMYIRYHGYKHYFTLHKKHGVKAKPWHTMHISHISHAVLGTKNFTLGVSKAHDERESTNAKSARGRKIQSLVSARCFSVLFMTEDQYKRQCDKITEARALEIERKKRRGEALDDGDDEDMRFEPRGGLTSIGFVGLDLELPFEGNGRSAREWVDGINALKEVFNATEYPYLKGFQRQKSGDGTSRRSVSARSLSIDTSAAANKSEMPTKETPTSFVEASSVR